MSNSRSFDIRFTDAYITVGPVPLVPRNSTVGDFLRALGSADRTKILDESTTLYIYDQLGIRFWSKQNLVISLQVVFETNTQEVFPHQSFVGPVEYRGRVISAPVPGSLLAEDKLLGFSQDTDALQYKMIIYEAKSPYLVYSAIVSPLTGNMQSLSVG